MLDTADERTACRILDGLGVPAFLIEPGLDGVFRFVAVNRVFARAMGRRRSSLAGAVVTPGVVAACGALLEGQPIPPEPIEDFPPGWHAVLSRVASLAGRPTRRFTGVGVLASQDLDGSAQDVAAPERMLDLQADLICCFTPAGRVLFVNESYARHFHLDRRKLDGRSIFDVIMPEDRELVRSKLAALEQGEVMVRIENRNCAPDGAAVWFEWNNQPIRDSRGGLVQIMAVGRDISERKRADLRLHESEQRYRQLLDTSPDAILVDVDRRIVLANRRACEFFGVREPAELLGQDPFAYLHEGSRRLALGRRERMVGGGGGQPIEVRLKPREGPIRELEMSAAPIRVDDQPGVVMTMRDVGPRKHQERQLRASEQRFRRLVQSLPEAFWIVQDGHCAFANGAAARLVGLGRSDELTGRSFLDLVEPCDHQRVDRLALQLALDPTRQEVVELVLRRKDGSRVEVEATVMTIQHFERPAVQITARDVTARNAEQAVIARMALHDPLTGLANRVQLRSELERACARARRDGSRVGLLCLDLDGFKAVNDSLGHAAGDAVLVEVAHRLRQALREVDLPARLGGDEFAIVLIGIADAEDVAMLGQRLIEAIARPFRIGDKSVTIGTSVGSTIFPDDPATIDVLLAHADAALYAAKRGGRGRHCGFSPELEGMLDDGSRRADAEPDHISEPLFDH